MAQVSKEDPRKRIMPGKWMKRLMHYAVPDKLREETDPITEWLIQRNDWKLIKYAIKQKYIGKKNADALLKYTVFLAGRTQIRELSIYWWHKRMRSDKIKLILL